jgi:NADH-quinone oxidoreductase subunit E
VDAVDLSLLEPLLAMYPRQPDHVIPLLRTVQKHYGYIPAQMVGLIAAHLHVSRAKVLGVATFYPQFSLTPQGRHKVCVCRGTACHVRGGRQVLDTVRKQLGVKPGETTADHDFTLETVACVGACAVGPVMTVDGECYGKLDQSDALEALSHCRREMPAAR